MNKQSVTETAVLVSKPISDQERSYDGTCDFKEDNPSFEDTTINKMCHDSSLGMIPQSIKVDDRANFQKTLRMESSEKISGDYSSHQEQQMAKQRTQPMQLFKMIQNLPNLPSLPQRKNRINRLSQIIKDQQQVSNNTNIEQAGTSKNEQNYKSRKKFLNNSKRSSRLELNVDFSAG